MKTRVFFFKFLFPSYSGGPPSWMLQMRMDPRIGRKKEKEGIRLQILGFLGDGFGVKEKKKAATGGLCPTVAGTH